MRTIKFRAWDKDLNKMFKKWTVIPEIQKENLILMQYTGLKDKNAKEIYEGDIISVNWKNVLENELAEVVFFKGAWGLGWINDREALVDYLYNHYSENLEVLGNIYEDKYLLEVEK